MYLRWYWALLLCWLAWGSTVSVLAQAPPAIQFFLPGGALPGRELRFTLTRADGRVEILLTDTKGKYQLPSELLREGDYTLQVESDQRSFDTTIQRFRLVRAISYIPVFLRPLASAAPPKGVVDVSEFDAKTPEPARAAYNVALKAVNAGDVETAINEFTRALALYPQYLRALNDLGVLYLKLHRLDEAAATFTQAISLNGRFAFPRLNLGVVRNRQGQSAEAVKILSQLLKEQPGLTQARLPLAEALRATQQWTAAEQQLREALKDARLERALQAEAHEQLGVLLNRAEQYVAAAGELEQAAALNPESASAQLYLGAAWLQLQKLTEAERALLRAYELAGPRVGTAQLLLGQLYYQQRKFDLAQRAFEQYLKDVPAAPNAAQIKEVLGKLKELLKQ